MAPELPWRQIILNFDKASIKAAIASFNALLAIREEDAERHASTCAPFVAELETPEGRKAGMDQLARFVGRVPDVLDLALSFSNDKDWQVRIAAAQALANAPGDPRAQSRLFELVEDPQSDVSNYVLSTLPTIANAMQSSAPGGVALSVIPDDAERERAIALVVKIESAVNTLQDLGELDSTHHQIIDDVVLPAIAELKILLMASADTLSGIRVQRRRGILSLGTLFGAGRALAAATATIANADEAVATLREGVQEVPAVVETLTNLMSVPF